MKRCIQCEELRKELTKMHRRYKQQYAWRLEEKANLFLKFEHRIRFYRAHIALLESSVIFWQSVFSSVKKAITYPWSVPAAGSSIKLKLGEEIPVAFCFGDEMDLPTIEDNKSD